MHMRDLQVGLFTIPAEELQETFETSGGPGGQHANRSATAVRLRLDVAGSSLPNEIRSKLRDRIGERIEVVASDSRSQFRNRAIARQRMRDKIERALIDPPNRRETWRTRASQKKRVEEKRARGQTKRLRKPPDPEV
jgi:ribosome-associated protein